MAEFLLMRHAKSEHPSGVPDRARPLSGRGIRSAQAVGRALTEYGAVPDTVLTSPAVRAAETARLAAEAGGWAAPIVELEALYSGGVRDLIDVLAVAAGRVLAVGHEPTWSATAEALLGGGSIAMVTGAVACIEITGRPRPGGGLLRWMVHPRMLGDR